MVNLTFMHTSPGFKVSIHAYFISSTHAHSLLQILQ